MKAITAILLLFSVTSFAQKKIIVGSGMLGNGGGQVNLNNYYTIPQVNNIRDSLANLPSSPVNIIEGQNIIKTGTYPNITLASTATPTFGTVTENKIYYRGELEAYRKIDTATGVVTVDSARNVTGFIPIEGNTSITMFSYSGTEYINLYGWTYDSALNPIAPIRPGVFSLYANRTNQPFTFTTPSNARYINCYASTYHVGDFHYMQMRINSANTITYNTPITPEQFTGTQTQQINKATRFAAWTSSAVELKGVYGLDSVILVYSGTKLILNNARLYRKVGMHDNFIRNEAVARQNNIMYRGNKDIKIIGVGTAIFEGSNEDWGSDEPTGVAGEYWKVQDILFGNVDGFEVSGLTFKATNGAAFYTEQCRYGNISNLDFIMGLEHLNQGGIALCSGSFNINVDNIRGVCMDDFFAVYNMGLVDSSNAILGSPLTSPNYTPFRTELDTYGINATNLQRAPSNTFGGQYFGNAIRIQCTNGLKIRDVNIDGVTGYQNFLIYSANAYGPMFANTISNLTISNVERAAIYISKGIKNSSFINVPEVDRTGSYLSVLLPDSSVNIYRKFIGKAPEWIDSVYGGVNYTTSTTKALKLTPTTTTQAATVTPFIGEIRYINGTNATFTSSGWWGWNGSLWRKLDN